MTLVEQLRGLLAAATPGEWCAHGGGYVIGPNCETLFQPYRLGVVYQASDNAALIVAEVNALPKLLAVVEAAQNYFGDSAIPSYDAQCALEDAVRALEAQR